MSLFLRLWMSFLVTLGAVLLLLYVAIQWSFDRGLIRYINEREAVTYQILANNIAAFHEINGDISLLKQSYYWRKAIFLSQGEELLTPETMKNWIAEKGSETNKKRRPPPKFDKSGDNRPSQPRPGRRPPPQDHAPVSLLDTNFASIKGPYREDFRTLPIIVDGTTIAYLAWPPSRTPTASYDIAFAEGQKYAFIYIAMIALSFGAIAAYFFSRAFIKPVTRIAKTAGQIAKGNYAARSNVAGNTEIAKLAADINTLAVTLEAAESARRDWLASTAHELRTPLSVIKGEFEAILDGIRPANSKTLASIEEEIFHLQKLIEDLYELTNADIGAYRYQMAPFDLSELLEETCQKKSHQMAQLGFSLNWHIEKPALYIDGDDTRIKQLIENLLSNSEKYTDSPGEVSVTLDANEQQVTLIFEDTAPSVPDAALPRLFEKLYRVESSRNRSKGGSGLGLAIVKKIVETHAGEITASHSSLGGLMLVVTLPRYID